MARETAIDEKRGAATALDAMKHLSGATRCSKCKTVTRTLVYQVEHRGRRTEGAVLCSRCAGTPSPTLDRNHARLAAAEAAMRGTR